MFPRNISTPPSRFEAAVFDAIDPIWIFSACVFLAVAAILDAVRSLFFSSESYRSQVNRRLQRQHNEVSRVQTIVDLRRERGLTSDGDWRLPLVKLNKLIVQSGVNMGIGRLMFAAGIMACVGLVAGFVVRAASGAALGLLIGGVGLPLFVLWYLRRRRLGKFTDQLAEAIDIIVRSLRAGHPVPSALKLAARELPDPIGSEFGVVEDEITFGLDLETAMRNMYQRVGQEDLPLFIASIAIQTSSGGNLTEILDNLSGVIRQRVKMRRKIRAISAEGRISALILSLTPIVMFAIINFSNPNFYGAHWSNPMTMYGLGGAAVWMMIGNLWMRKMINFRM